MGTRKFISPAQEEVVQSIVDCLSRGTLMTMRSDVAGVHRTKILGWDCRIISEVSDITVGGRTAILLYDGYCSHMGYHALKTLKEGGVMEYEVPAHISGDSQPLDVQFYPN